MNKRSFLQKLSALALVPFIPKPAKAEVAIMEPHWGMPWERFRDEYLNRIKDGERFIVDRKVVHLHPPGGPGSGYERWYFINEKTHEGFLFVQSVSTTRVEGEA